MRRSALDFLGGKPSMSLAQLSAILAATAKPLSADFAATLSHTRMVSRAFRAATAGTLSAKIFRAHSLFRHRKRRVCK